MYSTQGNVADIIHLTFTFYTVFFTFFFRYLSGNISRNPIAAKKALILPVGFGRHSCTGIFFIQQGDSMPQYKIKENKLGIAPQLTSDKKMLLWIQYGDESDKVYCSLTKNKAKKLIIKLVKFLSS